jgi:hypothetical protein
VAWDLGWWEDQLGRAVVLSTIFTSFLICQVALPLGITCFSSLCVCRELGDDQDETQDHLDQRIHEDQQCSLGHLNSL